jgi:hypothetical protein
MFIIENKIKKLKKIAIPDFILIILIILSIIISMGIVKVQNNLSKLISNNV